jgi:hypothetical protein
MSIKKADIFNNCLPFFITYRANWLKSIWRQLRLIRAWADHRKPV